MNVLQIVLGMLPKQNKRPERRRFKQRGKKNGELIPLTKETLSLAEHYVKIYRVADKGKRTYLKIVTQAKADRLLNGVKMVSQDGKVVRVPLKRKYVKAQGIENE